jgi:hypothetical protein
VAELRPSPGRERGRGLFGNSEVWVTETGAAAAGRLLAAEQRPDHHWTLPPAGATRPVEVEVDNRRLRLAGRVPTSARRAAS